RFSFSVFCAGFFASFFGFCAPFMPSLPWSTRSLALQTGRNHLSRRARSRKFRGAPARTPTHRKVPQTLRARRIPSMASPPRPWQIDAWISTQRAEKEGRRNALRPNGPPHPQGAAPHEGGESGVFDATTRDEGRLRPER